MRIRFSGLPLVTAAALTLSACSAAGRFVPAAPIVQSIHSVDPANLAGLFIGGSYQGKGDDSIFKLSEYALGITQTKSSLVGDLAWASKLGKLQTKLAGSITSTGYSMEAHGTCTGTLRGRSSGTALSGIYKLTCGGVLHTGSFGVTKVKKP